MGGSEEELDDEVAEQTEKSAKKPAKKQDTAKPPVFVNLDAFTVNLVPESGDQYLQVILSLELEDASAQAGLTAMMPRVRNNVTLLLSSKKASELQPKEGKEKLALEIMDEINKAISPPARNKRGEVVAPDGPVTSVLFTSFIIQ
jgi:flagellar FliL protein